MSKDLKSRILYACSLVVVLGIALFFIINSIENYDGGTKKYFNENNNKLENNLKDLISRQKEYDEQISRVVSSIRTYTKENPYIKVNPYEINPLSALIIFSTEDALEIDVFINNEYMSTLEKSYDHIIPVIGLLSNTSNVVKLEFSDGSFNEYIVETGVYDYNLEGYNAKEDIASSQFVFVTGDRNDISSKVRGFDQNNNLRFYYELSYISGVLFHQDTFYVAYNSGYTKNNLSDSLKLELNYLGKIISISTDTSDLNKTANVNLANIDYISVAHDVYQDVIDNYKSIRFVDNNPATETTTTSVDEISLKLDDAEEYKMSYNLFVNGNYLSYDFKDNNEAVLACVTRSGLVYYYNLSNKHLIKLPEEKEYSLYLVLNERYYNLKTMINT